MQKESRTAVVLVLLFAAIVTSYGLGYLALVERGIQVNQGVDAATVACYRTGGVTAALAFWPAHQLDRILRPHVWHESAADVQLTRREFRRFLAEQHN